MADQRSVKAQEAPLKLPAGSVSRQASPIYWASPDLATGRAFAAAKLQDPLPLDTASIARGRLIYERHCLSCHGLRGRGDGPVGLKFLPRPMDLTLDYVHDQAPGQLFYTISRGSAVMPGYGDAIAVNDRWHLIHYLKQGLRNP